MRKIGRPIVIPALQGMTLNAPLTQEMVTLWSHRKVWWECSLGHVWKAVVYSRTRAEKCGCPVCAGQVKERRRA